ncbi:MAG TPA: DUF222 domain-containing protein [Actinomycetes bacterium]|nr:DUF222 domain-containing protein [Actinomycetes bacterium]
MDATQKTVVKTASAKAGPWVQEGVALPEWASWPAGPELGAMLAGLDVARLDEPALVEAMAAFERQASWCRAGQLVAIAALAGHRSPVEAAPAPDGSGQSWADRGVARHPQVSEFVMQEVAARLSTSKHDAWARVGDALDLLEVDGLRATFAALTLGVIDARTAHIVAETARGFDESADADELRAAFEERLLPKVVDRTPRQARDEARRLVLELDPQGAEERAAGARAARKVILEPAPDATAWLSALLPAEGAVAVYTCLDLLARHAHQPDDQRSIDQRRADALVELVTSHPLITGTCWCTGSCATHPVPAAGSTAEPGSAFTPRAGQSGIGCAAVSTEATRTPAGGIGASGRRRHLVHLSVPAFTMLGAGTAPAFLHGYGHVPLAVAEAIAADAQWRRLLTDPFTGTVIGAEVTAHDPPPSMADLVNARYQSCGFGPCTREAEACDLDHADPHPHGPTSPTNLTPECRPEHRMKTLSTGWTLHRDGGEFVWTSPTGHCYPIEPAQVGTILGAIYRGTYRSELDEPPDDQPSDHEPLEDAEA